MVPVKQRAKEDGHHHPLYHCTNQAHKPLPTKERVCIWEKNRGSSEIEQSVAVSTEDTDIMYMSSKNIQFPQRYQQWGNTLRTAALWQVNINQNPLVKYLKGKNWGKCILNSDCPAVDDKVDNILILYKGKFAHLSAQGAIKCGRSPSAEQ